MNHTMTIKVSQLQISSPAFKNNQNIPAKYTCVGEGINPSIQVENIPVETQSLVLIAEDPDAVNGTFEHWIIWNIEPAGLVKENSNPGISGTNSSGKTGYHPPCPPSGSHRYYFYVYAMDTKLGLPAGASKEDLKKAMRLHVIGKGSIMGRFEKQQKKHK